MSKPTVRVRIAVAVDAKGNWSSAGWSGSTDESLMDCACETVNEGEARYWIEADLELPATASPILVDDADITKVE